MAVAHVSAVMMVKFEMGAFSYPEHIINEQSWQQQARHLQTGKPHKGYHGDAQAHG